MKHFLLLFFLVSSVVTSAQYSLVWSDEFDGTSIDLSKWSHDIGQGVWGWGNNELQYYTNSAANSTVDGGYLKITARDETFGSANYTSAKLKTKDLYEFTYGKVEARIKVPFGQGLWPAFWMLGANIDQVSWPYCGEIDLLEHVNNELVVHGTHHYDHNGHVMLGGSVSCDASEFQVYGIEWTPTTMEWSLNGNVYYTTNIGPGAVSKEEFHEPFYLILNLAVGGNWPGSPNGTTSFPALMEVDYVRVYQNNASVNTINPTIINVFPNPTSESITINSAVPVTEFSISDVHGKMLITGSSLTEAIDVSMLSKGMYYVTAKTENGLSRTTFVVE
ncbi:family 16 glycosylhydrolase [Crocinitomicaceae bacterium]|nr:family 16 glycosylhydrolase [Crocinitomicaceae bacterium]